MSKLFLMLFFVISVNVYSYSLGLGFMAGGGGASIKSLEATAKCGNVNDFEYKYKYGFLLINKFQLSETIFLKFNLSLIQFKLDFDREAEQPFILKTDLALEFYPIKEISQGFHFSGGLFINYFFTEGYSSRNSNFSMLSAFLGLGYRIAINKKISFYSDASVEVFDIISTKTKTRAYVGLSGKFYFLYDF